MPPFSVGVAQVEERLRYLRRRLNLLALQDGMYLGATVLLIAACLVVVLAVRGQATVFAVTLWAASTASALAIAGASLRVRRRWLSMEKVIRFADHRAVLEDRLPTLLLDRTRTSQLKDLLLAQTLAAAPRWDIDVLAPRRIPRSALLLAGSLAALIVTSYFVRPPAEPMSMAAMTPPSPLPRPDQPREHPPQPSQASTGHGLGSGHGDTAPEVGQQIRGDATAAAPVPGTGKSTSTGADHAGAVQESINAGPSAQTAPQGHSRERNGGHDDAQPDQTAAQLQDAIRKAFGAESIEREQAQHDANPVPPALSPERHRETDLTRETAGNGAAQPRPHSLSQRSDPGEDRQPGAAGAASSAGDQTDQTGAQLFAQRAEGASNGKPSQDLALKLNAFSSAAQSPSDTQPQRDAPSSIPMMGGGGRAATAESEEQVPDAPVQKADVAPEHEALVRRIFSRDE